MANTVIIHVQNEDPIVGEVEQLPATTDLLITISNPRRLDGKELFNLAENVTTVIWPMSRIHFIEVMPAKEEEEIISFIRE